MLVLQLILYFGLMVTPIGAYWRMSCMGVTGVGRIDPIVAPNTTSAHVHTLKGSGGES